MRVWGMGELMARCWGAGPGWVLGGGGGFGVGREPVGWVVVGEGVVVGGGGSVFVGGVGALVGVEEGYPALTVSSGSQGWWKIW